MFAARRQRHQVDDIDGADFQFREMLVQQVDGGQHFRVGTSPAQVITMSGSSPWSLLAHAQMPMPTVQCLIAASMSSHCGAGCLPAMMTLL